MPTRRTSTRFALEILQAIAWDNQLRDKFTYDSGESVIITLPFIDGAANDYSYELREVYTRTLGDGTQQEAERTPPSWISESFGTLEGTAPTTTSLITINLRWRATQFADSTKTLTQDFAFCINAANLPLQWDSTIGDQYYEYGDAVQFFLPTASGGAAGSTKTYTLVGTRPSWLVFDRNDQDLSGTAPSSESTTSLTWRVTDGTTTLSQSFDVVVEDPNTNILTWSAIADRSYSESFAFGFDLPDASGGTSPYTYSKRSGAAWVNVSAAGRVTGTTPAVTSDTDYNVTVRVTDDAGTTIDRTFTIEVTNVVVLSWITIADRSFVEGADVSFNLPSAVGGTSPYTYSKVSGNAWVSVSVAGAVSGTAPNVASDTDYSITVRVTDDAGATLDRSFTIEVTNVVPLAWASIADQSFIENAAVSFQLPAATGGTSPYTYTKRSGNAWVNVSSSGLVTGTTPEVTSDTDYSVTVRVTDDAGTTLDRTFTIEVENMEAEDMANLPMVVAYDDSQIPQFLYVMGSNGQLYHKTMNDDGDITITGTAFDVTGSVILPSAALPPVSMVVAYDDSQIPQFLYVMGSNGQLYHKTMNDGGDITFTGTAFDVTGSVILPSAAL